ncbi:hypothetical protein Q1695_003424 [Nippostrongylus brasiliensis]|nr:hypothetical protein Q1695_003424 [Nippostrongylus brasiliensis]
MFTRKVIFVTLLILTLVYDIRLRMQCSTSHAESAQKFVSFNLNVGRMGNQLFHLMTGYGIARSLERVHYIPNSGPLEHVKQYLKEFDKIFPALRRSYVFQPSSSIETTVQFADSCCAYENPRKRYMNHSATYLRLNYSYGQNPRYFEDYLGEVRRLLKFSAATAKEGDYLIETLDEDLSCMMCIHIRRTDFVGRRVATNVNETMKAVKLISNRTRASRFLIFGDDQGFMRNLSQLIISSRSRSKNATTVLVSNFTEVMDLYLSSRLCNSFLLTAVTSTFGWWLAFFVENQDAVYYLSDTRVHGGKVPNRELFLKPWKKV